MIRAALFDWDGTLVDSRAALLRAWHVATDAVLGRRFPATAAEEQLVFTRPGRELFAQLTGDDGPGALIAAFQAEYEHSSELVRAFAGVADMLGALHDDGVMVAVVTSKARTRYAADAARAGLSGLIRHAVCAEDTETHKPDPAPVLRALAELGIAADRAVMIGDTAVDIAAGAAAGTAVLGVAWGASGAGALIDAGAAAVAQDPRDLIRLVGQQAEARIVA
jgi:HAD superfamily hydrolase (TIGR01509 family)